MRENWTPGRIETLRGMLAQGATARDCAQAMGLTVCTIQNTIARYRLRESLPVLDTVVQHVQSPEDWQQAPAELPTPEPNPEPVPLIDGRLTRVLICPDVHVPYHDDLAWETFLAAAREWCPDVLVILGDFADFYKVSDYPKDPARRLTFQDEVRLVNAELDRVMALRVPRVIFIEGNHETRLQRLIQRYAAELHGIVDVRDLFKIAARGFEWVGYGHYITIGKLNFTHDCGRAGIYAARQSVTDFGHNIIFGHTHRAACHYESSIHGERHVGWTMGWLGDPEYIDYKHRAKVMRENQHGFGVAHIDETGCGWVTFVPIIEGRAVIDGQMISGRRPSP